MTLDQMNGTATGTCRTCDRLLDTGARACACGMPTPLASFKERSEYELKQWRQHQAKVVSERV